MCVPDMKLIMRWHGDKDPVSLKEYAQVPNLYGIVTSMYHMPLGRGGTRTRCWRSSRRSNPMG